MIPISNKYWSRLNCIIPMLFSKSIQLIIDTPFCATCRNNHITLFLNALIQTSLECIFTPGISKCNYANSLILIFTNDKRIYFS